MDVKAVLGEGILALVYLGDVVFAVSGALTAARHRMDVLGFVLIGTITGIGGGTLRDLLLSRPVWWVRDPFELSLCIAAALITYFFVRSDITRRTGMVWADAVGLSVFAVVGCDVARQSDAPFLIAIFMGMVTATGGGVVRDVLTGTRPMIVSGQLYATAALFGALAYDCLRLAGVPQIPAEIVASLSAFLLRGAAIAFDIRAGPPGELVRVGRRRPVFVFRDEASPAAPGRER